MPQLSGIPNKSKDVQRLEMVQRRAARNAFNSLRDRTPGSVQSLLDNLEWNSFEQRRFHNRLQMLWWWWLYPLCADLGGKV